MTVATASPPHLSLLPLSLTALAHSSVLSPSSNRSLSRKQQPAEAAPPLPLLSPTIPSPAPRLHLGNARTRAANSRPSFRSLFASTLTHCTQGMPPTELRDLPYILPANRDSFDPVLCHGELAFISALSPFVSHAI